MITALSWIPKGAARQRPVRFELSPEEYTRIKALAKVEEEVEAERTTGSAAQAEEDEEQSDTAEMEADQVEVDCSDLPPELRMDEYDDDEIAEMEGEEDGDDEDGNFAMLEQGDVALAVEEEEDEDDEDNEVRATDSVLVVAMTEDEHSHLEVQLLADDGNMFVHHDVALPDFPLCLAWMDCPPFRAEGGQLAVGNYIAVGTFNPVIEIWNLDVLDPLEPTAVLGGLAPEEEGRKKKKGAKSGSKKGKGVRGQDGEMYKEGSHTDAVMGLSWNRQFRQALASGSADSTVKIWDVTTQVCSHTATHHSDKVQSVSWHPLEGWLLASGSFDKSVALLDCRSGGIAGRYTIPADIEAMVWDPFCAYHLYCSMESGQVACFDIRMTSGSAVIFQAHDHTVSSLSFCDTVQGMLATASVDKTVKVWDVNRLHQAHASPAIVAGGSSASAATAYSGVQPEVVAYKSMNVGKLFALCYQTEHPFLLATGGDKGMVAVWESDEMAAIEAHFASRVCASKLPPVGGSVGSAAAAAGAGAVGADVVEESMPSFGAGALAGAGAGGGVVAAEVDESWMEAEEEEVKTKKHSKKDKKKKSSHKHG